MDKKDQPDKLAHEVSQAIAEGLSYGQWKAKQPFVPYEAKIPDGWKRCERCGKPFKPMQAQRFCDIHCRELAYRAKKRSAAK